MMVNVTSVIKQIYLLKVCMNFGAVRIFINLSENTLGRTEVSKNLKNFDLRCYFYYSKTKNVEG